MIISKLKIVIVFSSLCLISCLKPESYPNEPILEYLSFESLSDSGKLTFSFTDGDGNIAYQYDNASTTTTFSGTIKQDVSALTITSNTASLDASVANMFTLTLQNAADTHLELSNQVAGQNFILQIKNNATAAGTISFDSQFQFEGGTPFTATAATNALDILTFTSFGGNVQCVGSKNFS